MRNRGVCRDCGHANTEMAHFCGQCGEPLDASPPTAGQARHPNPVYVPKGFERVQRAADLYYRHSSAWGGSRLIGTETLGIEVFNAGYAMKNAVLSIEGVNDAGRRLFSARHAAVDLPRGETTKIEVPSYEIPEPSSDVIVALVSAEYA